MGEKVAIRVGVTQLLALFHSVFRDVIHQCLGFNDLSIEFGPIEPTGRKVPVIQTAFTRTCARDNKS